MEHKSILFNQRAVTTLRLAVVLLSLSLGCLCAHAQNDQGGIRISGWVKDASGQPIPGAAVMVSKTTIGVSTDLDGTYQIKAPSANSVLVFSCIGYLEQEIKVGNQTTINVVLSEDNKMLDEIVVVGCGVQ